jgi:hypothetical protein
MDLIGFEPTFATCPDNAVSSRAFPDCQARSVKKWTRTELNHACSGLGKVYNARKRIHLCVIVPQPLTKELRIQRALRPRKLSIVPIYHQTTIWQALNDTQIAVRRFEQVPCTILAGGKLHQSPANLFAGSLLAICHHFYAKEVWDRNKLVLINHRISFSFF